MPQVFIPPLLRPLAGGQTQVDLPGDTVRQLIDQLEARFPGIGNRLRTGDGLAPGLSVVVDGKVSNRGLAARVEPNSEVHFLPAIGGG